LSQFIVQYDMFRPKRPSSANPVNYKNLDVTDGLFQYNLFITLGCLE